MLESEFLEAYPVLKSVHVRPELRNRVPRKVQRKHELAEFVINEPGHRSYFHRIRIHYPYFQQVIVCMGVVSATFPMYFCD